ncbi:hypothetical protein LEP1GSC170_3281 [Leptospira interrogans serovar Bataviae str. HAI135]|nr:hypothetical protein LEP1GSC170_3281 [Leptospira interrogans serovar Bataviae str. HAI135]
MSSHKLCLFLRSLGFYTCFSSFKKVVVPTFLWNSNLTFLRSVSIGFRTNSNFSLFQNQITFTEK